MTTTFLRLQRWWHGSVKKYGLLTAVLLPAIARAQLNINTPNSVKSIGSIQELIPRLFNIAIGISGILFVGFLLYGGVIYLTSVGEEDVAAKARRIMINAGAGLAIVVTSWAIGNYVLRLLGIQVNLS